MTALAVAWVFLASWMLVFPEPVRSVMPTAPVAAALISFVLSVALARRMLVLQGLVTALGGLAIAGWARAAGADATLSHFTNLMLGLLLLPLISAVCGTERRLRLATITFVAASAGVLVAGLVSTDFPSAKFIPVRLSGVLPQHSLQLPGMESRGLINRNVLGILALVFLPFGITLLRDFRRRRNVAGLVSTAAACVCAGAVLLAAQSLSAWAAVVTVGFVTLALCGGRRRRGVLVALLGSVLMVAAGIARLEPSVAAPGAEWQSRSWTTRGVLMGEADAQLPGTEARARMLTETDSASEHSISSPQSFASGFYTLSVYSRASGRDAIWLKGVTNGARFDLVSGGVDDFNKGTSTLTPVGDGWYRGQVVFATPRVDGTISLRLLRHFPSSALYEGEDGAGVLVSEPVLERAETPAAIAAAVAALVRGSALWSFEARMRIWRQGLQALAEAPWFGIGLNNFRNVVEPQRVAGVMSRVPHVHNVFIQLGLDLGLVGLVVYLSLMGWLLRRFWQASHGPAGLARDVGVASILVLVGLHTFGLTDAIALGAKAGAVQWFACGLGLAAFRVQRPRDAEVAGGASALDAVQNAAPLRRVLIVGAFPSPGHRVFGGIVTACSTLMQSSFPERFRLDLIDSTQLRNPPPPLFVRLPLAVKRVLTFIGRLFRFRPEAVLIFSSSGAGLLEKGLMARCCQVLGIPALMFPRGGALLTDYDTSAATRWTARFSLGGATKVLCQGEQWHSFVTQRLGRGEADAPIVRNWSAVEPLLAIGRGRRPKPAGQPLRLLYVGWLDRKKGIAELIEAFSRLDHCSGSVLMLVGEGDFSTEAKRYVEVNHLGARVLFAGWLEGEALAQAFADADIFVLPSWSEGLPNAMIEAMAARLPVVATSVGNIPSVIVDRSNGLLVPPRSVDSLASALDELMTDRELRKQIADRAYESVVYSFAAETAATNLAGIIEGVIVRRSGHHEIA